MGEVIDITKAVKKETPNTAFIEKKKEAIKNLPGYRGEVMSKNNIRNLPSVNTGDIFWVNMDNKPYIVAAKEGRKIGLKPLDETATISTGLTIFEMNKRLVSKEPLFDFGDEKAANELCEALSKFFNKDTNDTYYLLYGRDIHYVTLFQARKGGEQNQVIGHECLEIVLDTIGNVGELISMDFNTEGETSVEIWIRTADSKAELLYLFPYDKGIVHLD